TAGELGTRAELAELGPEVDEKLDRRLSCLRKGLGLDYRAHSHVDCGEVVGRRHTQRYSSPIAGARGRWLPPQAHRRSWTCSETRGRRNSGQCDLSGSACRRSRYDPENPCREIMLVLPNPVRKL